MTPTGKVTTQDKHERFNYVLSAIANKQALYLYGPAGSGKNVICKQVADALGLDFYYSNGVTDEYKINGYMDAYGNYHDTPFYNAFKNGGLFMLDELDNSIPSVLKNMNAALANGYYVFANGETVQAHDDFRCISAGNTFGKGASLEYVSAFQLDASTLNRFAPLEIDYSRKIENSLADSEIVEFCRDFRKACKRAGIIHVVSYRNIQQLALLSQIWDIKDAVKSAVCTDLTDDDLNMIREQLPQDNKYTQAIA